ncbi:hypothetical protein C2E20_5130 [Micractinium conductrix]|uniref:Uncharacterized protein n=1 Tax=Micractinium conductrix TaxID=554055 RepID=A0A2P6VBZ0_9CHLO|nr:hypothetical protein C2E20_5130 [Micractinium conductrix]|eukprot:PSC71603.1 hypothetical protein C2E20_5130 [Micractinium conductrix]
MLLALGAAAAGVLPASSGAADAIWTYLMPTGAACYLLESDLSQLVGSAGPTMVAFFVGAVGTLLGTVVAYALVGRQLGPDGWKVAAALCASYIGGALNFAAVSQALTLAPGPLLAGAMTADNCVMALYIACIMSIPAEDCRKAAAASSAAAAAAGAADARAAAVAAAGSSAPPAAPAITAETLALSLAAAALACWLGNSLAATAGFASCGMAVMALLASAFGMLASRLLGRGGSSSSSEAPAAPFAGAEAMGGAFMMLFFATIGASAGSLQALKGAGWLAAFILLQLSVHLSVCLAGGRLLRLPMQAVLVASNANVGGPATAAAMASSKGWPHMIQPAMLTGSLGYAVATALGLGMARWLSTCTGWAGREEGERGQGVPGGGAGGGGASAVTGAVATADKDLGDLRPDMSLSEEEIDEAEHYSLRAHVHRLRLKPQLPERHLDEESTPDEEAPGEEAYKEAGPLMPPESEEEEIVSDIEEEARNKIVWQPETPNGVLPECVPLAQLPLPAQQTRGTAAPWEEAEAEAGEAGEDEASAMQAAARAAAAAQEVAEEEEGAEPSSPVEARDPWAQVQQPRQDWRWLPAVGTCYPSAAVK